MKWGGPDRPWENPRPADTEGISKYKFIYGSQVG